MSEDSEKTIKSNTASLTDSEATIRDDARVRNGRLKAGDVLLGRYEVLSELGQGGMGVVYRCLDKTGGVEVAVKALPPELSHSPAEMDEVRDNFRLVSSLIHQNIAAYKTLEMDSSTGDYYLIMEYVNGEELRRWMRRKRQEGELTLDSVLPILRQVAEALDFAHLKKIMHRDVKPGNIMVDADGIVKVLDFGLAAQIRSSMSRVSMAYTSQSGTRQYKSPEQWRGQPQDAATDLYALAVMAYEMLSGHVPFDDDDPADLREIVLKETPMKIDGLPDYANEALLRGLAKAPVDRYKTCVEFVNALAGGANLHKTEEEKQKLVDDSQKKLLLSNSETVKRSKIASAFSWRWRWVKWPFIKCWLYRKMLCIGLGMLLLLLLIVRLATTRGGVPELVKVEAGSFMMGSPEGEDGRNSDETQHRVKLTKDFWIGKYEVTQRQYKAVMGVNPSHYWYRLRGDYPVQDVSWNDAMGYCKKLTEQERRKGRLPKDYEYSLPTEAQWEYAARGGNKSKRYIYSGSNVLDEVAWYEWKGGRGPQPVGKKMPNELGIYDMSGNVNEWCIDSCDWNNGAIVTDTYKEGLENPLCSIGIARVVRGGDWGKNHVSGKVSCRSAYRSMSVNLFGVSDPKQSPGNDGFRVALVPVQ